MLVLTTHSKEVTPLFLHFKLCGFFFICILTSTLPSPTLPHTLPNSIARPYLPPRSGLRKLDDDPKMSPKTAAKPAKLPVTVDKPTPYHFDLGLLLANDPNPLSISPDTREADLAAVARDGTQVLINQLLTTCPISATKEGVLLTLPPAQTALPREKPIPAPKAETKWSAFAKRRGIKSKTREQRRNLAYDEATGEFGRKWGYKGANKAGQDEPIIEVPFNSRKELERKEGTSIRGDRRREIREKIKKNEKQMRKNQGRNAEGGR